jgi:hypothetical protein
MAGGEDYLRQMVPFVRGVAITTSDTVNLTTRPCRGIYVGGAGNMVVVMAAPTRRSSASSIATARPSPAA